MFTETVKNFLLGDVSGVAMQNAVGTVNSVDKSETAIAFSNEVARILREAGETNDTVMMAAAAAAADGAQTAVIVADDERVEKEVDVMDGRDFSEEQLRQAHELMVSALETISKLLGLEDGIEFDLEHVLKLEPQSIEQLADILWGIDNAIKLLEQIDPETYMHGGANFAEIVGENHPLSEIKSAGELTEFMSQLRTARSHIGLALYTLELQDVVSEQLSHKHGESVTFGLTQAANPADLGMSISDLATVFQSLIREEMGSAVDRLRAIANGQAEMTELEKAAVRMNTVESAILKASLANPENPIETFDFSKVNLSANTTENTQTVAQAQNTQTAGNAQMTQTVQTAQNTNTSVQVIAQTALHVAENATSANVPLSMSETVKNSNQDNLVAANRTAQQSVDVAVAKVTTAADTGVTVPLSVADQTQRAEILALAKATEMVSAIADKITTAAASGAEVPLSAGETVLAQEILRAANATANVRQNVVANNESNANVNGQVAQHIAVEPIIDSDANANTNGNANDNANAKPNANVGVNANASANEEVETVANANGNTTVNANVANTNIDANVNANINADVNTNVNANVNASANANTNSAGQSTVSGVGIAFAETNTNEMIDGAESADIDNAENEDGVAKVESAEIKSAQETEKNEKVQSSYSRLEQEELIRQLTERMHYAIRNGAHEVRMILRPESLGEVRMSIRVHGDVVMARAQVENRQVKAIIENNMQSLKEELAKHNLNLDGFSVDVGTESDKSPRQTWREMAEASLNSGLRSKFKLGINSPEEFVQDEISFGTDTGRRFGSNTFEYFI